MSEMENVPTIELEEGPHSITMYKDSNGYWIITHHDANVTTQGKTRYEALLMLADALSGVNEYPLEDLQETAKRVFTPPNEDELSFDP